MSSDRTMTTDKLIEVTDIGVCRNGRWLLRHVSLGVSANEIVTVIGPNGGGKTTLARVMLG
ncbi:MAG: ATP-binding cassette domain-containing protein, partial [Fimbriimonadaceae bacterium]|nr:ATP-binding cassette domain-containing protein [Alphaproteobacteria bacterium]